MHLRRWEVGTTLAILALSIVASLLGLFRPGHYPNSLLPQYYVQDATMLVVGVPLLAAALWHARRGSFRGRIVWLGALAYMAYTWAHVGIQAGFNRFYLGYVALFALSLFTLIGGTITVDARAVRRTQADAVSERLYGGFLVLVAVGLAVLWLAELVPATLTGTPPTLVAEQGPEALVTHFIDLGVVVPSLLVSGVWLWRARPWGYVLAGIAVVFGAILTPTIVGMTVVILAVGELTVSPVAIAFTVLPLVAVTALAVTYVLAISPATDVRAMAESERAK
ncbi:hypothetical protein [Natronolimnohabitans innermongolicus]|uniref:Uncharacterized protein n=1 Tax=Natronolimnohabitans innermongolicus JCM 12255 TaxID=1227499 RepID=L9X6H4_9EURY|nr:hypothetical protein [Natronolimnohabitans innermongolicus]ELY57021.1 hypothetical protein C493_09343 [Natronolimnohabitans innermongolicus JCM 12255]